MNMENEYFTKDVQDSIRGMTDGEMKALLLELESTIYWTAILKYIQQRMIFAQNGLLTIDPIAKATEICRSQGIMMGQSDLQNMVILLKRQSEEKKPNKNSKEE